MVVISIDTIGHERMVRGLSRFGQTVKDWRPVFRDIQQDFYKMEKAIFRAQGKPQKFTPLSPRYRFWKEKNFPGKTIMRLNDRLYNSLTGENQADAQDTVVDIKPLSAEFGTRVPYAERHQLGRRMPQRKVVQVEDRDRERWMRMIHRFAYKLSQEYIG